MTFKIGDKIVPVDFSGISGLGLEEIFKNKKFLTVKNILENFLCIEEQEHDSIYSYFYSKERFKPYEEYFVFIGKRNASFNSLEEAIQWGKNELDNFTVCKIEKVFNSKKVKIWEEEN